MNARTKNLVMVGGAVLAIGFVGLNTLMPAAPQTPVGAVAPPSVPDAGASPGATEPEASPAAVPATGAAAARRSYAVGLHDLAGFPPDAAPGARVELWVTWEPPVTDDARLQKLIGDVVVERTIPGSVPEAPVTILLSVPVDRVGDLIYADTFGKLSVALPD